MSESSEVISARMSAHRDWSASSGVARRTASTYASGSNPERASMEFAARAPSDPGPPPDEPKAEDEAEGGNAPSSAPGAP